MKYCFLISFIIFSLKFIFMKTEEDVPLYLSIEVNHHHYNKHIHNFILKNLKILRDTYPNNSQINSDYIHLLEKNQRILKNPDSWHVTTLYIGHDLNKLETSYYKDFEEDVEVKIPLLSFAYIPGRLIATPVFLEYTNIENKLPHMTLVLGGKSKAVDSNYLLKSVFSYSEELKLIYENGLMNDPLFTLNLELKNIKINYEYINEEEIFENAYLIKTNHYVKEMIGRTRKNYDN